MPLEARVDESRGGMGRSDLELFGQLALILRRIDIRVRMIVEQAEEAVQTYIDRSRLHHFRSPRIK